LEQTAGRKIKDSHSKPVFRYLSNLSIPTQGGKSKKKEKKMKRKIFPLFILTIITMVCFACSPKTIQETLGASSEPENNSESPTPEVTFDIDLTLLEEPVEVSEGGFVFRPVKDYQLDISNGTVVMLAPEADPDLGPVFQIMGMYSDEETTPEDLLEQLQGDSGLQAGPAQSITIDGENGLLVDLDLGESGIDKLGKMAFFVVEGHQQFVFIAGSTGADWENFGPIVESVLATIEFIELVPGIATSNIPSGNYAYSNRNVIRDLDEKNGVVYAATLGGLISWRMDTRNIMDLVPTTGMGHISANAVVYCEVPEPRVLVGTLQGISVFNPNTGLWEDQDLFPSDSKVNTSKIERLYCDQDNHRLLIGYTGLGILDLNSGDFQQYTDQNGLLWNSVTDIAVRGEEIWVASGYKGVARISNGQVTTFTEENGLPDDTATALEFSNDGTLWIGTSSGLASFKNGNWNFFGSESPASLYSINEIEVCSDNSLWIATASLGSGRLCLYDIATASCTQEYADPDNAPILALTTSEIAEPIFGTNKGITILDNNLNLYSLKTTDQLVSNYVDALTIAPDGNLWVGTDGGIQVLDPANPDLAWTTYHQSSYPAMGGNWASAIAFSPDGTAWMSMINGNATSFRNGEWRAFEGIYSYNAVAVDGENRIWFADDGKGVVVLDEQGEQVLSFTTANGLPGDNVQALLIDNDGTIWIGTNQGLAKYSDNALSVVFDNNNNQLPNLYIRALALDQAGRLLIGTFTGIAVYDGQSATTLIDFLKDGYSDARLTTLACTSSGEVWAGTDKGLLHGNSGNGWSMMTTETGLLTNYISALTIDPFDTIWVGGGGSNFDGGGLLHIVP
jgi:ligand-binding sensor domain-containing protein